METNSCSARVGATTTAATHFHLSFIGQSCFAQHVWTNSSVIRKHPFTSHVFVHLTFTFESTHRESRVYPSKAFTDSEIPSRDIKQTCGRHDPVSDILIYQKVYFTFQVGFMHVLP